MKIKKILAVLSAVCLCAGYLPLTEYTLPETVQITANAAGSCGDNLTWELSGTTLTISGTGAMTDWSGSGSPWYGNKTIQNVIIEDGVTSIGAAAFYECSALQSVTMGNSVRTVGYYAFNQCKNLSSVTVSNSLTTIDSFGFYECSALKSIDLPESVATIKMNAFWGCSSMTSITIRNLNCSIYDRNGTFPDTATIYGYENSTAQSYAQKYSRTFMLLDGEADTTPPESDTIVNSGTCGDALTWTLDNVGTLKISGTGAMTDWTWGGSPWYQNKDIKNLIVEDGVTTIGAGAFGFSGLVSISLPSSVTSIGQQAFSQCKALHSVTLPDGVTTIGADAFSSCDTLTSVILPDSVTTIGDNAFKEDPVLTSIELGNGVQTMGIWVFANDAALESITLPDTLTSMGQYAFYQCKKLSSVKVSGSLTDIGIAAFYGCPFTSIDLPESIAEIKMNAFYDCSAMTSITIRNMNCVIKDDKATIPASATIYGHENSTAQAYAQTYNRTFSVINDQPEVTIPEVLELGDINGDDKTDASDAAQILAIAAAIGAGMETGLTDSQNTAADINQDGKIDATDAAIVLKYAALVGAGQTTLTLAEYIAQ